MTRFKSRQVNLDPEPYVYGHKDTRVDREQGEELALNGFAIELAPRPEFEPTRDPFPYVASLAGIDNRFSVAGVKYLPFVANYPELRWAPRREQFDTPINPILVEFRRDCESDIDGWTISEIAAHWCQSENVGDGYATPEQIDHAHRVLTRLANMNGETN